MISIKSFGSDGALEQHEFSGMLGEFLDSNGVDWRNEVVQPIIVSVNGNDIYSIDWDSTKVSNKDAVEIIILPRGGVFKAIGKVFSKVFSWLMPKKKPLGNKQETAQGRSLERIDIKANNATLGAVVPECFGRFRRYPDYLTEPRRFFAHKRHQAVYSLVCIGVGSYKVEDIKAGDTALSDLSDSFIHVFEPGQHVGQYAESWHTSKEVGGTSNGTAGLDLSVDLVPWEQMINPHSVDGYNFSGSKGLLITRLDQNSFNEHYSDRVSLDIHRSYGYVAQKLDWGVTPILQLVGQIGFITEDELKKQLQIISGLLYEPFIAQLDANGVGIIRFKDWQGNLLPFFGQFIYADGQTYNYNFKSTWQIKNIGGNTISLEEKGGCFYVAGTDPIAIVNYASGGRDLPIFTNRFSAMPNGVKTSQIEVDFFFPNGLCWVNDDGSLISTSVGIQINITDKDTGNLIMNDYKYYSDATTDQIGFTERIQLPYFCEPLVKVRRLERGSDSAQSRSNIEWMGLKGRLPDVYGYPNWTVAGIMMASGGRVSAQSENAINMIVTRILPQLQYDGTWSEPRPVRDIASCVRYIAHQIGYTDNDIDMDELLRLHNQYWVPRKEHFDFVLDETTVKDAIEMALNAGMSNLTISNGKIKPVRDEKRTILEQSYSAQNIIGDITHSFKSRRIDDYDGVEVEYVDPSTFDKKVVQCLLPGSHGLKIRKLSINGVNDKNRAYIIGMREASIDRYINKDFSFKTEMDAFNSDYMSYIAIIDDVPKFGQSALILAVDDEKVTLSEDIREKPDIFSWRDRNGKLIGPFKIKSFDGPFAYVDLGTNRPIVSLNYELPHAYLGTEQRWAHKCLVTDITPNGIDSATISAINYDDRIYDYDNTEMYKNDM